MKFVAKQDVEAPIEKVFAEVSDFEGFARSALRRGASVRRMDRLTAPGPGMAWHIEFNLRGKRREVELELEDYRPPEMMRLRAKGSGLDGTVLVDLMSLARKRTRLRMETELKPQTLSARLLIQSMKLARGNIDKRIKGRMAEFAKQLEERHGSRPA